MVFRIRGEGLVEGLQVGGLPDGTVDNDTLAAGTPNTAALPSGCVLQVKSATKTDTQSFTGNQQADVTGMSVSITPSSTNSQILVFG
jgi:hypothetical protein